MVGEIAPYEVSARPKSKVDLSHTTVDELWTKRKANNRKLFFSVTEIPTAKKYGMQWQKKLDTDQ